MRPTLHIHLAAFTANYQKLADINTIVPVVKADAYGLGLQKMAGHLRAAQYFVATLEEGINLRAVAPKAVIFVFNGLQRGEKDDFIRYMLTPVLNTRGQIMDWRDDHERRPAAVHVDTGMARLGLTSDDVTWLAENPGILDGFMPRLLITHLASAEEYGNPFNAEQRAHFIEIARCFKDWPKSLANSAGMFLGADYHFDFCRPGMALYGLNPVPYAANPMQPVVQLTAPVIQRRSITKSDTVGYSQSFTATGPRQIATLAVGYADGYLRSLSNKGEVAFAGQKAPVVGRVSMDLITVDVTDISEHLTREGMPAEIIGTHMPADILAQKAGTIGYELLTSLGTRYKRVYREVD